MAVPGFSVTDLIQALTQVKVVYDAFLDKNANSAAQVADFAEDVEQFQGYLQKHKDIVEKQGLNYPGYKAIEKTLRECRDFLNKYALLLDKTKRDRKASIAVAFRTVRYAYQDDVKRLQAQISRHGDNMLQYKVDILLENMPLRQNPTPEPASVSQALPIPGRSTTAAATPPASPRLYASPDLIQGPFTAPARLTPNLGASRPPILDSQPQDFSIGSPVLRHGYLSTSPSAVSPLTTAQSPHLSRRQSSITGSPRSNPIIPEESAVDYTLRRQDTEADMPVLPQPALGYGVATIHFTGCKPIQLLRKPKGRNFHTANESGRDLIIVDEHHNVRLRHRIKLPPKKKLYPLTWHSKWVKHHPLEVTFIGMPPEAHSVTFKQAPVGNGIPRYVFTTKKDFMEFQSEVRGKELVDIFEFTKIESAASTKYGEASDQHLKVWRDRTTQDYSISFYASVAKKPKDIEFPISLAGRKMESKNDYELTLNFSTENLNRKVSAASSRSPTERSASNTERGFPERGRSNTLSTDYTIGPGTSIFSRRDTVASSATSITVPSQRPDSVVSFQSDAGAGGERPSTKSGPTTNELLVKEKKYFKIEFTEASEAKRFKKLFQDCANEEASRPLQNVFNWNMNVEASDAFADPSAPPSGRFSTPGTPFTMSPVLQPQRSELPDNIAKVELSAHSIPRAELSAHNIPRAELSAGSIPRAELSGQGISPRAELQGQSISPRAELPPNHVVRWELPG